jgi:hypothetical protein
MLTKESLATLELGRAVCFANLTMFPLYGEGTPAPDYITLDEALATGSVHVTEVSAGGSVPELRLVNDSDRKVLLMDGEEVVGAKQNRTLNISILAPARTALKLPVTCVEAGRWAHNSAEFTASPRAHYAAGRAHKHQSVSEALTSLGSRAADQSEVWADIDAKAERMCAHSPTHAMADMYAHHETGLEEFVGAFPAQAHQRGAVFAIDGKIIGVDLFDHACTLGKLLPKIVRSYALDAIDARVQTPPCPAQPSDAAAFLDVVAQAGTEVFPAIGIGEDVRFQADGLTGGALAAEGRIVHLSAFAVAPSSGGSSSGASLRRASMRRRGDQ